MLFVLSFDPSKCQINRWQQEQVENCRCDQSTKDYDRHGVFLLFSQRPSAHSVVKSDLVYLHTITHRAYSSWCFTCPKAR